MDSDEKREKRTRVNQWIATLGVFLFLMQMGIIASWSSPNIAYLTGPDSPIPLSPDQASWLASLPSIGSIAGSIAGSVANTAFGSKKTIFATFAAFALSWTTLAVGDSATSLYLARVLAGLAHGAVHACFSLYLGEISSAESRGTLIATAYIGGGLGALLGTAAETYLAIKVSSCVYLAQSALGMGIFWWLADSPYHHMKRRDHESAKRSIAFYDGHGDGDGDKKFAEIKEHVEAAKVARDARELRESLLAIVVLYAVPHLAGVQLLTAYLEPILRGSESSLMDPQLFAIAINSSALLLAFLTRGLIDKLGRRVLLLVSSLGVAASLSILGVHFHLLRSGCDMRYIQWLPHLAVTLAMATYGVGFATVPSTVLSEIFTTSTKSVAACLASLASSLGSFVCVKMYQPVVDEFGEACAFWLYAAISLTLVPFALLYMIETKGKSFQEIQDELSRRRRRGACKG